MLEKAGIKGTLKRTLNLIGSTMKTPTLIVCVADAEDVNDLTANIVGTQENGKYTGLKALLTTQLTVFVKLKLLAVPRLDNQAVATELLAIAKKLKWYRNIVEDYFAYHAFELLNLSNKGSFFVHFSKSGIKALYYKVLNHCLTTIFVLHSK